LARSEGSIENYETSDARPHARSATAQQLRAGHPPPLILFSLNIQRVHTVGPLNSPLPESNPVRYVRDVARRPEIVSGIAWFSADQWQLLRSLATDAEDLEETHEEWVKIAEKTIEDLARQGLRAQKVDVDVNELRAWCLAQNRRLDSSARAAYAAVDLQDLHENA
jgi:hypothetical protein